MTRWAALRDAYGSAAEIPGLLRAVSKFDDQFTDEWAELWSRLCHQGTVYPASYAAVPLLAQIALRHVPAGYLASVGLAGAILASTDGPTPPEEVRRRYAKSISELRKVAERTLRHATNDTDFLYDLEALLAFEDGGPWQRDLTSLLDGELSMTCPSCTSYLLMDTASATPTVGPDEGSQQPTEVGPVAEPQKPYEIRVLSLVAEHGRSHLAQRLHYLFGEVTCPICAVHFMAADGL